MKDSEAAIIIAAILSFLFVLLITLFQLFRMGIEPNVEVFVDKELVYKGTNACVDVSSGGYATTVNISNFLCILPHKTYTSRDVIVNTVK